MEKFSYWEYKQWFRGIDVCIIGSGIVGLSAAIALKRQNPASHILVVEKGILPEGASTKNAGFACFGSPSEILENLKNQPQEVVLALIEKRWRGLQLLKEEVGEPNLEYVEQGGFECFFQNNQTLYQYCLDELPRLNKMLNQIFNRDVFQIVSNNSGFRQVFPNLLFTPLEGQLNPASMMFSLRKKATEFGVRIVTGLEIIDIKNNGSRIELQATDFSFETKRLGIATNGFANQLLHLPVKPARAQVLITEPVTNLRIKGNFHIDRGYYYFRNVGDRILLGGARNHDFESEETNVIALNQKIQTQLDHVLQTVILPERTAKVAHRWAGIMGVNDGEPPMVKKTSPNIAVGVRLGGMGVAIGSLIGKELAELLMD